MSNLRDTFVRLRIASAIVLIGFSVTSCGNNDWVVRSFPETIEIVEVFGACSEAPIIDGFQAGLVKISPATKSAIQEDELSYFINATTSRSGRWKFEHWRQTPLKGDARSDEAKTEDGAKIWVRPVAGCYTYEKPDWANSEEMTSLLRSYNEGKSFFTVEKNGNVMIVVDPQTGFAAYFFLNP